MRKRLMRAVLFAVLATGVFLRPADGADAQKTTRPSWTRCVTAGHRTTCRTYPLKREHRRPTGTRTSCRPTTRGRICEAWPTFTPRTITGTRVNSLVLSYSAQILSASHATGIDPRVIAGMIMQESRGIWSVSSQGADGADIGLLQYGLGEAAVVERTYGYGGYSYDPATNILTGAGYLKYLLTHTAGGYLYTAVAQYNGGYAGNYSYAASVWYWAGLTRPVRNKKTRIGTLHDARRSAPRPNSPLV